jgi:hypothetical protein
VVDHITGLLWPTQLCGPQPVDGRNSAQSRSGTPHNPLLTDTKCLGLTEARVSGADEPGRGSRSADPSQCLGQPRIRWPSQRRLRGRRRRARQASVGSRNSIAYVALDRCPVRRNGRLLGPTPHNWLGHRRTVMWSTTLQFRCYSRAIIRAAIRAHEERLFTRIRDHLTPITCTRNHSLSTTSFSTAWHANPSVSFRRCTDARS